MVASGAAACVARVSVERSHVCSTKHPGSAHDCSSPAQRAHFSHPAVLAWLWRSGTRRNAPEASRRHVCCRCCLWGAHPTLAGRRTSSQASRYPCPAARSTGCAAYRSAPHTAQLRHQTLLSGAAAQSAPRGPPDTGALRLRGLFADGTPRGAPCLRSARSCVTSGRPLPHRRPSPQRSARPCLRITRA